MVAGEARSQRGQGARGRPSAHRRRLGSTAAVGVGGSRDRTAGVGRARTDVGRSSGRASTARRRRSVFYNVLQYAVELELLDFNPVDKLRVRSSRRKVAGEVDRRVVVNIRQRGSYWSG